MGTAPEPIMTTFFARLKQRKLVQWALAYLAGSWVVLQGFDLIGQQFDWPLALLRGVTLALVLGFFVVLVLAWYHGERGAQRLSGAELLILALLLAIGGAFLWRLEHATPTADIAATIAPTAKAGAGTRSAAPIPAKSIAVLPLANESGNPDERYFSDGLSEDLITALSQFGELKVIGRNSSFQFRDSKDNSKTIGEKLGVAHLLEGSVRRAGNTVRVSVELVNAADGSALWSQRYDRPYKDLFALQDEITNAVAAALKTKLLPAAGAVAQSDRPPSGNLDAYAAYLHAKSHALTNADADFRNAIDVYDAAIRLDPRYAAAYAGLSAVWSTWAAASFSGAKARHAYAEAAAAATTAVALDPELAAAYSARGQLMILAGLDWKGAEAEYRRALQLAPNDGQTKAVLGQLVAALGRTQQAVQLTRQALATDPLNARWYGWLSNYLLALHRPDEARQAIQKAIGLQPTAASYHEQLAIVEIVRGDARAALTAARQEIPGGGSGWRDVALALALQVGDDRVAADAALQKLINEQADVAAYQIAEVYALRRDPDRMFAWLDRAWTNRDPGIIYLLHDPFILRYKSDPRFAAFCQKVGLPTPAGSVEHVAG
ncbi:MAG TPA: tetratricopeptide repeat protein [Gammaproteobacteria bacterium]|nr:tetratricopeptide repeat protein [Gammaproteobacteria bacterium]